MKNLEALMAITASVVLAIQAGTMGRLPGRAAWPARSGVIVPARIRYNVGLLSVAFLFSSVAILLVPELIPQARIAVTGLIITFSAQIVQYTFSQPMSRFQRVGLLLRLMPFAAAVALGGAFIEGVNWRIEGIERSSRKDAELSHRAEQQLIDNQNKSLRNQKKGLANQLKGLQNQSMMLKSLDTLKRTTKDHKGPNRTKQD